MPPPTISWSHLSASAVSTSNLVETFEPPTIAAMGRAGFARAFSKASNSWASSGPAQALGAKRATPWVEACARWAVPKASMTKISHSAAYCCASCSSSFFSPLLKRTFSSRTTSPLAISNVSPRYALISGTGRPNSSPKCSATGASENSSAGSPSVGRPKWLMSITFAPAFAAA